MSYVGDAREVGWHSWKEWSHVRKLLYSFNDRNTQIKGINMVKVWKSRVGQRGLPVSVDLTAALVAAYVGNSMYTHGNEYEAQMSSAMAILRFVNGVTDQHQTGLYAQSVQEIADKIDIPDWMVDMRHEAAHGKLPGFDLLKSGLTIALNWLDTYYWEETSMKLVEKEQTLAVNLNKQLGDYADNVIDILMLNSKASHKGQKEKNKIRQRKVNILEEISNNLLKYIHLGNLKVFINTLLQRGYFVFNQQQINTLEISSVSPQVEISKSSMDVLTGFSGLWKPLLNKFRLAYPVFIDLVTAEIIKLAKKSETTKTNVFILAMLVIFRCCESEKNLIIRYLLKNPSHLGFQIMKIVIEEGDFSSGIRKKFISFLDIFQPVLNTLSSCKSSSFDISRLDIMGTDASLKGKELIDRLKDAVGEENKTVKETIYTKSWCLLSDVSTLPAMGEFTSKEGLFDLDLDNCTVKNDLEQNILDSTSISKENMDVNMENDNLKDIIDNLFMDTSIYVRENDGSSSSTTDEYKCDDEAVWDEDVDFNIDDKDALKSKGGNSFFYAIPKNLADCDASKIMFF